MRWFLTVLAALAAMFQIVAAQAGGRAALVIGNARYESLPTLRAPDRDARLVADALRAAGFDRVELATDLKRSDLRRRLRAFGDALGDVEVALVYFAGHGAAADDFDYVLPVDARLEAAADIRDEAISLDMIRDATLGARRLRMIVLDTCRNEVPRPGGGSRSKTIRTGVPFFEPGENELVAYARRRTTMTHGCEDASVYAAAFARSLAEPGLDVLPMLRRVRDEVLRASNGKQEPTFYGSLGGGTIALHPGTAPPAP